MRRRLLPLGCALIMVVTSLTTGSSATQVDGSVATVSFGVGLNTAQPGNAANHHVLPQQIRIKRGGVVNFVVAGLHQIIAYQPGIRLEDITTGSGFFINDTTNAYYIGIIPAGGPPATPVTTNPSNAINRVESVAFPEPGTYLVICNVRGHFLDGMYAYVTVLGPPSNP